MDIPNPAEALASVNRSSSEPEPDEKSPLPPIETFHIDETDDRGHHYEGTFVYTVPKLGAQIKIGQMKNVYLPLGTPDVSVMQLVDMICYLAVTCAAPPGKELPAWFNSAMQLYDPLPLNVLYKEVLEYEGRFLSGAEGRRADEGDDRGEGQQGRDDSIPLGRKVQPPAERRETLAGDGAGSA